ncbi:hypothetical protein ACFQZ4_50480 [Catellatospora coxensis]
MERLLAGDVTEQVRAAAPHAAEIAATDQFLLVTVKFWKNAFKYNSFCYHVVTMDLGALLGTWRLWNAAQGLPATPTLWFDDAKLNGLLGLDGFGESVLAVVPLPWARPAAPGTASAAALPGADPAVGRAEWERSLSVHRFTQVEAVHQATLLDASARPPAAGAAADAAARPVRVAAEPVSLPPPDFDRLDADVAAVLRRRRSSFGAFVGRPGCRPRTCRCCWRRRRRPPGCRWTPAGPAIRRSPGCASSSTTSPACRPASTTTTTPPRRCIRSARPRSVSCCSATTSSTTTTWSRPPR